MSKLWKLKAWSPPGEPCAIQGIYDKSEAIQARLDSAWEYLSIRERQHWANPRTHAARLDKVNKGEYRDFYEIRFKANKIEQRPIGYFGPGDDDFTILIWATEQGNQIRPKSWKQTATDRMANIGANDEYAIEFVFKTEEADE